MHLISKSKPANLARLTPDFTYHIFNRTNHKELLFRENYDRVHFLHLFKHFVAAYVDSYAYCLLPNHFHFLVRLKSEDSILETATAVTPYLRTVPQGKLVSAKEEERDYHAVVERQFKRMFTAYAMYFNRKYKRKGNLFYRPFKRVSVKNEVHLQWLVYYIHHNPAKHGVSADFLNYQWSSYQELISKKNTILDREQVWAIFGSKELFLNFHQGEISPSSDFELEE
jgi:REP element-mobilizing transposase RayT